MTNRFTGDYESKYLRSMNIRSSRTPVGTFTDFKVKHGETSTS